MGVNCWGHGLEEMKVGVSHFRDTDTEVVRAP